MKVIIIPESDKTPEISFDSEQKIFEIKGMCLPENILDFNQLVIKKLENYLHDFCFQTENNPNGLAFNINFKLGYFNSSATKFIANVLMLANGYIQKKENIRIYWYFLDNDHDMLESGQDMSKMIEVPMEYIKIASF